jgi:hypothetical protein
VRGAEDGVDQAGTALVELGAGRRWAFPMPAPVALVTLVAGARLLPVTRAPRLHWARIDVVGAVLLTSAMLLVVYTRARSARPPSYRGRDRVRGGLRRGGRGGGLETRSPLLPRSVVRDVAVAAD